MDVTNGLNYGILWQKTKIKNEKDPLKTDNFLLETDIYVYINAKEKLAEFEETKPSV